jgi:hypothetical protein
MRSPAMSWALLKIPMYIVGFELCYVAYELLLLRQSGR